MIWSWHWNPILFCAFTCTGKFQLIEGRLTLSIATVTAYFPSLSYFDCKTSIKSKYYGTIVFDLPMSEFNFSNEKKTMKISDLVEREPYLKKGRWSFLVNWCLGQSWSPVEMWQCFKGIFPQRSLKIKGKGQHVLSKKRKYFIEVVPTIFDFE